jgi:MFS family permease
LCKILVLHDVPIFSILRNDPYTIVFPEDKRGMGIALWGLRASLGPAIGPTVGGYLTEYLMALYFLRQFSARRHWTAQHPRNPDGPGGLPGTGGETGPKRLAGQATAHFLLQDLVAREALMGAFNDCFLSLAGVALVAVLPPYS